MKLAKCKFLIDGTGAAAQADIGLLIDGERILDVKPLAACTDLPADIEIIDLETSGRVGDTLVVAIESELLHFLFVD